MNTSIKTPAGDSGQKAKSRQKAKPCPKCQRMITPNNLARHLTTCSGKLVMKPKELKEHLDSVVAVNHPRCAICKHPLNFRITRALIAGEASSSIIDRFSGKNESPEFTRGSLISHYKHLHLEDYAIKVVNSGGVVSLNPEQASLSTGIEPYNYTPIISKTIVEKGNKVDALILSQLAKLELADVLFREMIAPSGTIRYFDRGVAAEQYRQILNDIDALQLKIIALYKDAPQLDNQNVSVKFLWSIIYSMEKGIIEIIVKTLKDPEQRLDLSVKVGEICDKHNAQLRGLIKEASVSAENPLQNVTESLRGSIYDKAKFRSETQGAEDVE